jgi:hypothetical protein
MLAAVTLDSLIVRANREAEELGHTWIGVDHFVLALLRPADQSIAAQALRSCALTHGAYAAELSGVPASKGNGRSLNPAATRMLGRAEGLAAGLGALRPEPDHLLLAILWDPDFDASARLRELGVTRHEVLRRLREAGASLPAVDPPAQRETQWGERVLVPIGQLPALTAELVHLLPPGASFGFNHDGKETGWLIASNGVDLPTYVAVAIAAWEAGRLPCSCCRYVTLDRRQPRPARRCEVCWWSEDLDPLADPARLAEARRMFDRRGDCDERFRDRVRPPRPEEVPPWRTA